MFQFCRALKRTKIRGSISSFVKRPINVERRKPNVENQTSNVQNRTSKMNVEVKDKIISSTLPGPELGEAPKDSFINTLLNSVRQIELSIKAFVLDHCWTKIFIGFCPLSCNSLALLYEGAFTLTVYECNLRCIFEFAYLGCSKQGKLFENKTRR